MRFLKVGPSVRDPQEGIRADRKPRANNFHLEGGKTGEMGPRKNPGPSQNDGVVSRCSGRFRLGG